MTTKEQTGQQGGQVAMTEREAIAWIAMYLAGILEQLRHQSQVFGGDLDTSKAINRLIQIFEEFRPQHREGNKP